MELSLGTHTQLVCRQSKTDKIFWYIEDLSLLFFLFPLSPTRSSFHPTSLNFLIAGRVKNQQWRPRLRRPAAAVIETVMRRGSAYTGRMKDSSTHTPEKGKDGRADVWMRKRRVQTGSKRGRAREEESEVDRRWLTAESTAAEASQEKHWSKQLFSSHSRDVEHHNWKVHLGAKLDVESATLTLPTFCLTL